VSTLIWGEGIDGWFYTKKWMYYQRCEGKVVSYIERMIGFYRVHITFRGELGICDIEFRHEEFDQAMEKAMELLDKYKDAEIKTELQKDYYSPHNPEGYWQTIYYKK